jgi:8-oxo-dGTP pyrophosphatase MutT (NUDIX family)
MTTTDHTTPISIHIPPQLCHLAVPLDKFLESNPKYNGLAVGAFIFLSAQRHGLPEPRLLLIQRAASEKGFPNLWEVPGGASEPHDPTVLHSVAREVFEETGLRLTRFVRQLGDGVQFMTGPKSHPKLWIKLSFEIRVAEIDYPSFAPEIGTSTTSGREPVQTSGVEVNKSIPVCLDPNEHQAHMWVTEGELLERGDTFLKNDESENSKDATTTTCEEGSLKLVSDDQMKLTLDAFALQKYTIGHSLE